MDLYDEPIAQRLPPAITNARRKLECIVRVRFIISIDKELQTRFRHLRLQVVQLGEDPNQVIVVSAGQGCVERKRRRSKFGLGVGDGKVIEGSVHGAIIRADR